jgi:hypothetical protein
MNRSRYEGYRAVQGAVARQALSEHPAAVLGDLAEGLLLARDDAEAGEVVERVPAGLVWLVDRGDIPRLAAHRFWALLRRCGPRVAWPVSWESPPPVPRSSALR